ncbi:BlaI/MecI/CopY family transcriptional regulator, partial [Streptomyces chryseus]
MVDGTEKASPDGRGRRRQGELETQVLSALGRAPGPVTAAWVQEQLGGDLAYTTVITILT